MPTLAELQDRLERLRLVRANGARTVAYDGGASVTYHSDAELAAAIADLQQQILAATGVSMAHTIRITATKGFDTP